MNMFAVALRKAGIALAQGAVLSAAMLAPSRQALCLDTSKPLKQYGRQSWQSDTGLPQNTVHSVLQTRDGFLWFATEGGLVRFDGQDFRTFDSANTPELKSDAINDLTEDAAGALWASTSGGLVRVEHGRRTQFTTAQGLPSNIVRFAKSRRGGILVSTASGLALDDGVAFHALEGAPVEVSQESIAEGEDGTMWIASGQQVLALSAGAVQTRRAFAVPDIGELQTIAAGPDGQLWVGGKSGLALFRRGQRVPLNLAGLDRANITALLAPPSGDLWVGTGVGLLLYSDATVRRRGEKLARVNKLFADREGSVWAAYDAGVTRIVHGDVAQSPFDLAGVLSIFEDREGNMWFGTDVGGATVLREQAFSTITTQDGLSDDFVRAVFEDHAGTVWLGTNRGGLNRIVGGKISSLRAGSSNSRTGLSSNVVLALAEAGGDLWIGTPDGLSRLHDGRLQLFTTVDGLPDDFVRSLYADRDGSIWIGTRNGLSHYAQGVFTSYSALDGLGSDLIGSIQRDSRDGALWVGTLNGLSRFDGTQFRNFTRKEGLGGDAITALGEDSDGTMWIAAHTAGLTRFRNGKFTAIDPAKSGLPPEIYSIMPVGAAADGSLWLGSSKGIFHVSLRELDDYADGKAAKIAAKSYGVADGMKISECSSGGHPAAWRMKDGSLWFATLKGAASLRPEDVRGSSVAALAAIEDVLIDEQPASGPLNELLTVPPGRERITIHFAGLSFTAPQKVRFRYKLEGFDKDWIEAGPRRTAYYTNIPHGSYRFLVYASNDEGVWSLVPGEVRLKVQPRFYQTAWFYVLAALSALTAAYFIYRLRVRSVESRYQAVLAERNRIAREIHDTLAQGYVGVSVQLEVASRLLRGTASDASARATAQLEHTKELVRSSLAEARSSIWNLRSPGTESETLPARLSAAVQACLRGGSGGAAIRFDVRGTFRPLPRSIEDEVLRVGQEAISNAVRHASAKEIAVALSYDTTWLMLTVADDGKGFIRPPGGFVSAGHYGLQGMEERAKAIGASLLVSSEGSNGTSVALKIDLREHRSVERER